MRQIPASTRHAGSFGTHQSNPSVGRAEELDVVDFGYDVIVVVGNDAEQAGVAISKLDQRYVNDRTIRCPNARN